MAGRRPFPEQNAEKVPKSSGTRSTQINADRKTNSFRVHLCLSAAYMLFSAACQAFSASSRREAAAPNRHATPARCLESKNTLLYLRNGVLRTILATPRSGP